MHCTQCHCYVCDSLAPCLQWGTGTSSIDHCHATDKEEYWRTQRKLTRKKDKIPPISAGLPFTAQVPPLLHSLSNSILQNQGPGQMNIRPCSMSNNYSTSRGRLQSFGCVDPRRRFQTQLISQHLNSNFTSSSDRRHGVGNRGPQFTRPYGGVFKRSMSAVNNRFQYNKENFGSRHSRYPFSRSLSAIEPPFSSSYADTYEQDVGRHATADSAYSGLKVTVPESVDMSHSNYQRSPQQRPFQPYPNCSAADLPFQPQISSQPHIASNLVSPVPAPFQVASQLNVGNNVIPPTPSVFEPNQAVTSQIYISNQPIYGDQPHSQLPIPSQPNMDEMLLPSFQPQAYDHPTFVSNDVQNIFNQDGHSQNGSTAGFTDFDFNGDPQLCQNGQQVPPDIQSAAPTNDSQQQISVPQNGFGQLNSVDANSSSIIDGSDIPFIDPDPFDFQFDGWMFDEQPSPGSLGAHITHGLNIYSPEPGTADTGTLFDI